LFCQILNKGTGIPIVFLHGFLGSSRDWQCVVSHLKGRTCLAYDLPGHGNTPWTAMDIQDLFSSALPPEPVDLVGYSMGGRLALRFALQNPSRIHSLTLLSTHYGIDDEEEKKQRLQADRIWAQKILVLPFDEFLNDWYDQPVFSSFKEKKELKQELFAIRHPQRPKDLVSAMLNWSLGRQDSCLQSLLNFSRPWKVLYGEMDKRFAALYSGWPQAHSIPKSGHGVHLEAPQEVAAYL
jgi:2-succinyl-6-hydroxy-2,4-cyclohexadiene-1-carboxylate synthase